MRALVFDTETTGLPETKIICQETLSKWPYIVQLSCIIYDDEKNDIVESKDYIIKIPSKINISDESSKIHGITNEISQTNGLDIKNVLVELFDLFRSSDIIIGHNILFDLNMIRVELLRIIYYHNDYLIEKEKLEKFKLNLHYLNNLKNIYCTLQESINLCNIQGISKLGKPYLKYPKLIELHQKLFETIPNNLHNSYNDILVTLRCYAKMKYNKDLYTDCEKFKYISNEIQLY